MKSILLAVKGNAENVLGALKNITWRKPSHPYVEVHLFVEHKGKQINLLMQPLPKTKLTGLIGDWMVYQLIADPGSIGPEATKDNDEGQWITRSYRVLKKLADDINLSGPWTIDHFEEDHPEAISVVLMGTIDDTGKAIPGVTDSFPLLVGSTYSNAREFSYRPTQREIDDDIDWTSTVGIQPDLIGGAIAIGGRNL